MTEMYGLVWFEGLVLSMTRRRRRQLPNVKRPERWMYLGS